MTVEERRAADPFPAGLRVLAVDDDSTCLRLLETMLRRCKYHVTTTNQAVEALRLLRESKDQFDLVISDVHMPDMDGFKLLELVGLEMDLPVIMLSGNSDPKAVMKGITHGACDYLVKPVRMEELRNIWQHVVRRRRLDVKDRGGCDDPDMARHACSGQAQVLSGSSDRNGRPGRKRKDQSEDEEEEFDDIGHDNNEDSSAQKKPRVVWTVDLHRKFVAAVNQLGMDKAMPKRILDLMNVEKLTRENVASHLQKYRQYLKRIRQVASQQASMVAALGGKNNPFLSMGSLDGVRCCSSFPVSGQPATLASFQQGNMLGRLNRANNQAFFSLGSSGMIQLGRAHGTASDTISDMSKFPQISFSGAAQQVGFVQGMPMLPLDSNQLQQQQQQQKLPMETSVGVLGGSGNPKLAAIGSSNNSFLPSAANGLQLLQAQPQQPDGFGCPPPTRLASIPADPFDTGTTTASSNPPDISRCNEAWGPASAPLAGYMPNTLQQGVNFNCENGLSTHSGDSLSSIIPSPTSRTSIGSSATNPIVVRDLQCHGNNGFDAGTTLVPSGETDLFGIPDIGGACGSVQRWDNPPDPALQQSFQYTSSNSLLDMVNNSVGFKGGIPTRIPGDTRTNQSNVNAPYLLLNQNIERLGSNNPQRQNEYGFEPATVNAGFDSSAYSSNTFDELMSAIVKLERDEILMDGDISCDLFSLETCM